MLLFSVALLAGVAEAALGGDGLQSERVDQAITLIWLSGCMVYLYFALGRAYPAKRLFRRCARWAWACSREPSFRSIAS